MGLTGIVVDARIRLSPIRGPMLSVDTDRVRSLDGAFAALAARGGPYRVAWLDLLAAQPVGVVRARSTSMSRAMARRLYARARLCRVPGRLERSGRRRCAP